MGQFADEVEGHAGEGVVLGVLGGGEEQFGQAVFLEFGGGLHQVDQGLGGLFFDGFVGDHQYFQDGVKVPPSVDRVFLDNEANLQGQFGDELLIGGVPQYIEEFFDDALAVFGSCDDIE